jgi:hypothetical protein
MLFDCVAGTGQDVTPRGADMTKPVAIQLKNVDAEYAARKLKSRLRPGVEVDFEKETATVFLRADIKGLERAKRMLARLDARQPQNVYVLGVENADPVLVVRVVEVMMAVIAFLCDDPKVRVSPNERDSQIVFTASDAQATCVCWLVRQLDWRW